ncbi:G-patch domain and KOW motifs-containing protein-like, partial [Diaphorina citri]|uniref:G-patch domain and KOW motifs-containing protein-like n=1 Tax=Diaphorina citri TaxID=121845 RepID=A0A1S4ERV0_DIACI
MAEEKKTISFGFSKLKAPSKVIKPFNKTTSSKSQVNAVQYIDCLENQSIKVKDEILEEKKELVIPLKQANITRIIKKEPDLERVEVKQELNDNDSKVENISTKDAKVKVEVTDQGDANSLDAQARREILESLNNPDGDENETKVFSLPLTTNAPKEGEKEPTLDDYENIPIQEFGLAMLRGMGWKPDENKNKNKPMDVTLRPKGLGLGADK